MHPFFQLFTWNHARTVDRICVSKFFNKFNRANRGELLWDSFYLDVYNGLFRSTLFFISRFEQSYIVSIVQSVAFAIWNSRLTTYANIFITLFGVKNYVTSWLFVHSEYVTGWLLIESHYVTTWPWWVNFLTTWSCDELTLWRVDRYPK